MKRFFAAPLLCACIAVFSMTALAQSPMEPPPYGPAHVGGHVMLGDWEDPPARRIGLDLHREPRVLKKGPLAPSSDDRIAFTSFLKDKNTGLIRLLPREVYDSGSYRVEKGRKIRVGGGYFSFARLTHDDRYGVDIELDNNSLSAGTAGAEFGMLTNIGDAPLERITLDKMLAQYIAAYRPPRSRQQAREDYRRLSSGEGKALDGFIYNTRLPVKENSTYLLRSIAYGRSDVLVAFRLARKDADGSVILAWKLLKQYPTPELKRKTR